MANPLVQFVDSISTTAAIRYDFSQNAANYRALPLGADAIDFGKPTFDGEPEGVGGRYGYRQIQFTQRILGTRTVALARMSVLAKELLRATNWLRFQWDPSATPVYFKTYRAEPGTLSLENAGQADAWDIIVPLIADPFAYGPRVTQATFQVVQSPADLTGPTRTAMRVVLPAIQGDAPTRLRVQLAPAASGSSGRGSVWMIGCTSGETAIADPVMDIGTGDGLTAGSGTAAGTSNASYFSGSYRAVTISAGANNLERLSGALPTLTPGRYKVLLRAEADAPAGTTKSFLFTFGQYPTTAIGGPYNYGTSVKITAGNTSTVATDSFRGWVDLGDFSIPRGLRYPKDLTYTVPTTGFSLKIGTPDSTAGAVRIDAMKFVPVDGPLVSQATMLKATFDGTQLPVLNYGYAGVFDGDDETFTAAAGVPPTVLVPGAPALAGAFPVADPAAAQNLLTLMVLDAGSGAVAAGTTIADKDAQTAVVVSYYPRYLHIGDGT